MNHFYTSPSSEQPFQAERLPGAYNYIIHVWILVLVPLIVGGIYRLDIDSDKLTRDINQIYYGNQNIRSHRGSILDTNGIPLAINANEYSVYAHLNQLRTNNTAFSLLSCYMDKGGKQKAVLQNKWDDKTLQKCSDGNPTATEQLNKAVAVVGKLATVFDMSSETMLKKLASASSFTTLRKKASPEMVLALRQIRQEEKNFPIVGLEADYRSQRFYPKKEYFAHLVGYTDFQGEGKTGVESWRQDILLAHPGKKRYLRTSRGEVLRDISIKPAKTGIDLQLSVDSRLQYYAYEALQQAVTRHKAKAASAIVMDAKTGGVLALVNYPSFNPNNIQKVDERLQNYALAHAVEPGSVVKPFVVAMALEDNKTQPSEILPTKKPLRIGRQIVKDSHIRENLNITGVIAKSSNVGAVLLAHRLGKERLWDGYQRLGFGGDKLLYMAGETQGALRHHSAWQKNDFTTHAYGYGFSASLMQLLSAYSVFATDGVLLHPFLDEDAQSSRRRVFAPKTAQQVRLMMEQTVSKEGTASAAKVTGYRVAGKTGTTYKWHNGKYDTKKIRAFFVGMAPASNPSYLIAVMIDEPRHNGHTGGAVAAPVFSNIMRRALLLGGDMPDDAAFLDAVMVNNESVKI